MRGFPPFSEWAAVWLSSDDSLGLGLYEELQTSTFPTIGC